MLSVISNGNSYLEIEPYASLESLYDVLQRYPLDRVYSRDNYFDLCHVTPKRVRVFGNFVSLSHVFNIWTDEPDIITKLVKLVQKNTRRGDYLCQIDLVWLWWVAESKEEIDEWRTELAQRGGTILHTKPVLNSSKFDVFLSLPRQAAKDYYSYTDESLSENDIGLDYSFVLEHIKSDVGGRF